jgi:quercetin dioxygenase-like cupin family protein
METSMKANIAILAAVLAAAIAGAVHGETPVKRTPLSANVLAPAKTVANASVTRIDFAPGQPTGRHLHPVPVIAYVLEGEFIVQIEGQPAHLYKAGETVFEPANTVIERYDNASLTKSAVLIANYLAGPDDKELIKLLPAN